MHEFVGRTHGWIRNGLVFEVDGVGELFLFRLLDLKNYALGSVQVTCRGTNPQGAMVRPRATFVGLFVDLYFTTHWSQWILL